MNNTKQPRPKRPKILLSTTTVLLLTILQNRLYVGPQNKYHKLKKKKLESYKGCYPNIME